MQTQLRLNRGQFESDPKITALIGEDAKQWILDNLVTASDKDEFCINKENRFMEAGIAGLNMLKLFALSNGLSENDIEIKNNKLVLPYTAISVTLRSYINNDVLFSRFTIRSKKIVAMELAVCVTVPGKKIQLPKLLERLTIVDNSPIDNIVLPSMLDRLEFRPCFNQPIDGFNWEELDLTEIVFCNEQNDYRDFDQSAFNQPLICLVKSMKKKLTFFGLNATVSKEIQAQINNKLMAPGKKVQVNYWWCWDDKPHKQHHKYTCTLDAIYL